MGHPGLLVLLAVLIASFTTCIGLVLTQRWHGKLSLDHDLCGVQKIHKQPVPRIGGVALLLAIMVGIAGAYYFDEPHAVRILTLLGCAMPAFIAGLAEDITKRVGVRPRLYASFASAALAAWCLDASLTDIDTPGINLLIAYGPVSLAFTCFAVGGLTNAVNIIDGINGLAAGSVMLMLAGLGTLAWFHADMLVLMLCSIGFVALAGFLLVNYPGGRIFLGDGGAYLAGFWLAECAVLLLVRRPAVSTWAVLLTCCYPVVETLFSVYRRHVIAGTDSSQPDQVHLHHVLMNRLRMAMPSGSPRPTWRSHAGASLIIWILVLLCQALAIFGQDSQASVAIGLIWFFVTYLWLYTASTHKMPSLKEKMHRS
mgnify:CR=1 FL=1